MHIDPIIEVLTQRRKEQGISREKMAQSAGMSLKTYQRIERGESDMKLSQYRSILRALHLTDLDIALDIRDIQHVVAEDVLSAARLLSPDAQALLTKLIFLVHKESKAP
ncbi:MULTISPECIES: helix-turn-helix domain-containing protein [Vibrio]|uniref:Helix-turn-helix domain-containing protein n=1 Tax=Vibrio rotiferianus TaxID=190895 RepID=A0A7Y3Z7J2_9VIBR|nr:MULTISPECIES: helix-turn-helix domain-containing protein [Vibrio]MDK9777394.1 helix-turn-helix domain-containing protein [Vibrio sp. D401a]MDK9806634.1 helix-turn-helix domain-containing protein [Vibrio sp. D406a]NOH47957.1 helix-turn-helix domain-containing protein [Vibrio rotiferianus]NOH66540.1 helix-turn-helix domain-containing protein [Vibrio rotiferianus]TMX64693.1 transcriptional regulator [Vibrio rotiferianus]